MKWDENLEGNAVEFAGSDAQRTRCLAGPGTGKTYALMHLVQRLIQEKDVPPGRILIVTLTRTAADDLRSNLLELGVEGSDAVLASTLHSFCFSILLREEVLAITHRHPRILLSFERDILLKDLPDSLGTFTEKKKLLIEFQAAWSSLDGSQLACSPGSTPWAFEQALLSMLRWHRCMLVGELVPIAKTFLEENPYSDALNWFTHVLVDEYQDLNRADQGVIELLGAAAIDRGGQLGVIGDDDQCIYVSLRNAHPRGIVDFEADVEVPLVECRRCPKRITSMAQSLIEHNPNRTKPPLEPRSANPPGVIHNVMFKTMHDEAEGLARFIDARIRSESVKPGEVLVLANWRRIAHQIRDLLLDMGHEAHSYFREQALDTTDAKHVLTLLTLIAHPKDRVALRSYLALNCAAEGRAAYRRITNHAEAHGLSAMEVLEGLADSTISIPYTKGAVDAYRALRVNLAELSQVSNEPEVLIDLLCPEGKSETKSLRQAAIRALHEMEPSSGIEGFVMGLRTQIGVPEVPLDAQLIRLMSLHNSKGLTVKLVVIAGLVEGLVPRYLSQELSGSALEEHIQEQRRMLFVGVTRPTSELVLSRFQRIDSHSAHISRAATGKWCGKGVKTTVSSSLLRELGPELPDLVRGEVWQY